MTFIIAEVGSNWSSFEDCSNSIVMAKNVGADAVKFQLFNPNDLYGAGVYKFDAIEWIDLNTFAINYRSPYLDPMWIPLLIKKAAACGIEFMCTAFSDYALDLVDIGVKRHKIPSSLANHPPFIEAVKSKGKPILASTGGLSWPEICRLVEQLYGTSYALLYCISAYPSEDVDLESIEYMTANLKGNPSVGYSCHTSNDTAAVAACKKYGATILEKHFKLREDMDTPDSPHSLNPQEFQKMVKRIRGGRELAFPSPAEAKFCITAKSRCVAIKPVTAGDKLEYGVNFGFYRTLKEDAKALTPYACPSRDVWVAARDIAVGAGICVEDLM